MNPDVPRAVLSSAPKIQVLLTEDFGQSIQSQFVVLHARAARQHQWLPSIWKLVTLEMSQFHYFLLRSLDEQRRQVR